MTEATENWYESATRCALLFALTIGLQAQSSPSLPSLSDAKRFSSDKPWREKTPSVCILNCGGLRSRSENPLRDCLEQART